MEARLQSRIGIGFSEKSTICRRQAAINPTALLHFRLVIWHFITIKVFAFTIFINRRNHPIKYADAVTETASLPDSKCGLKPYVATITSAEEQDFSSAKNALQQRVFRMAKAAGLAPLEVPKKSGHGTAARKKVRNSGQAAPLIWGFGKAMMPK